MIEIGEKLRDQGVTNIRWIVDKAENLEIERVSIQLITIGEAFPTESV